jgi:hypothetical protein
LLKNVHVKGRVDELLARDMHRVSQLQLAGEKGVAALGAAAKTTPPGTETIANVFATAGAPVLLLFDD